MVRANVIVVLGLGACSLSLPERAIAGPGALIARFALNVPASQDFDFDGEKYYVTNFLNGKIHRYTADFRPLQPSLDSPFSSGWGLTGIAYDSLHHTLWVAEPLGRAIAEIDPDDGTPTGREFYPEFKPGLEPFSDPLPRGMAFDPSGNDGAGSLYVADSQTSLIYELSLTGTILKYFSHPDDRDGYPGEGAAGPAYDIELLHDATGSLTGYLVLGGSGEDSWVRRLHADGSYSGFRTPLIQAGGPVYALKALAYTMPGAPPVNPALQVLVAAKAEIAVLDGTEEPLSEIWDLACRAEAGTVTLTWQSGTLYDRIELVRDCRVEAVFPGGSLSGTEKALGPGVYRFHLVGIRGDASTESAECTVVVGGGQVIRAVDYEGSFPADLTVDDLAQVYVSDLFDRDIRVYDEDLFPQRVIELPFLTRDDQITGLAFSPADGGRLLIYDAETNFIHLTDREGNLKGSIAVSLPNDPQNPLDKAGVGGMTFIPDAGPDRKGMYWLLETTRELVYSLDAQGNILSTFPHPVSLQSPVPPLSRIHNSMWGLSEVPQAGSDAIDITSGTVFESREHVIRVDGRTGQEIPGVEIPLDDLALIASGSYVGIQHAVHSSGRPTLYAIAGSKIAELSPAPSETRPITGFTVRQDGRENRVLLSFAANDDYSRIEVGRDCESLLTLNSGQFQKGQVAFADARVTPGLHRYDVRGVKGSVETTIRSGVLRVGPGAILDRNFDSPLAGPYQLSRDPVDGTFLVVARTPGQARNIYRYRSDLTLERILGNVIPEPWEIATVATRRIGHGGRTIYLIAMQQSATLGGPQDFPLFIIDRQGNVLDQRSVTPPRPTNGFSIFPTALCYSETEDLFYYLERNSATIVVMDGEGQTLRLIPHPSPPFQSYVFNLGMCVDPENGTILLTSAGPEDQRITRALQMTRGGRLTGLEVPLDGVPIATTGIAIDGPDLVIGGSGMVGELIRIEAFQPIAAPRDLTCIARGTSALLTFQPGAVYDQVTVLRDGGAVAVLPGDATSYQDTPPDRSRYVVYSVAGRSGTRTGKNAVCELPPHPKGFIRGDVDGVDQIQITDVISILGYLFLAGEEPACDDAADADDDGVISISDPIAILEYLFLGAQSLPAPFPEPGEDPTADSLTCS
jgi:hypothetical protein